MAAEGLVCDYLVVGTGAMGMAFVDTLLMESTDCTIIMVDRQPKPGGHWNYAYEFVTLHQPALRYGVPSERLEEEAGNLRDLSTGPKIAAYFHKVLEKFLASGRVKHFGEHEYLGEESQGLYKMAPTSGKTAAFTVKVQRKFVDAAFLTVTVPSMRKPPYAIDGDVRVEPLNVLANLGDDEFPQGKFCVVGGGKTGIDAVLYLLKRGTPSPNITWIMPNDQYYIDRDSAMFGAERMNETYDYGDSSLHQAYVELGMLRLDPKMTPTKFRCCTISQQELKDLRTVENVVRMGRVRSISKSEIVLECGTHASDPSTFYIDCTANGLTRREPEAIFTEGKIILQSLVWCTYVFSAAATAKVELCGEPDTTKNYILDPASHPEDLEDRFVMKPKTDENSVRLRERFPDFLAGCRLIPNLDPARWPPEVRSLPYPTA